MRRSLLLPAVAAALAAAAPALEQPLCVGGRPHVLRYDVEGEPNSGTASGGSLDGVRRAVLELEPAAPGSDGLCSGSSADQQVCLGANQDAACTAAKADIPLEDGLACRGCFAAVSADVYYKLNFSAPQLHSVEVGLRNIHARGGLGLGAQLAGAAAPITGSKVVGGADKITLVDTTVGCPVCVRVKIVVSAPTALSYTVTAEGKLDATLGAELDADLGEAAIRWDETAGWTKVKTPSSMTVSPVLVASGTAVADLGLGMNASLQVEIDDILSYRFSVLPSLPLECTAQGALPPQPAPQVCVDGSLSLAFEHEADLHWSIAGFQKEIHHWGPTMDNRGEKSAVHMCQAIEEEMNMKPYRRSDVYT